MTDAIADAEKMQEERNRLFKEFKTETEKRQVSSSENFDKSVLTYSSWALGISIAFLKDFIPITFANFAWTLYGSWVAFVVTIAVTTISFLISYKGLEVSLYHAGKYYLEENDEYLNKDNRYNACVTLLNRFSAVMFIVGLILTLIFVCANLERSVMVKNQQRISPTSIVFDGVNAPLMTRVAPTNGTLQKGMPAASMQPISSSQKPASQPAAASPAPPPASQLNKSQ